MPASGVVFNGAFVKTLKAALNLKDTAYILTGTADPRTTATLAPSGSVLLLQGTPGLIFLKLDNGSTTNWKRIMTQDVVGNADEFKETLRGMLEDTYFQAFTYDIPRIDGNGKVNGSSTAAYTIATDSVHFSAVSQTLIQLGLLDSTFLVAGQDISEALLVTKWLTGFIDPIATYELSRDGGVHYQTVTMTRDDTSDTFVGDLVFTPESDPTQLNVGSPSIDGSVDNATVQYAAGQFVAASAITLTSLAVDLQAIGTPAGQMRAVLYNDASGVPGTALITTAYQNSTVAPGGSPGYVQFPVSNYALPAGTYWISIEPDATYRAGFSVINFLRIRRTVDNGGATFNGTTWAASGQGLAVQYTYLAPTYQTLFSNTGNNFQFSINASGNALAQSFTIAGGAADVVQQVQLRFYRTGSPQGNLFLQLVKDDGSGKPSTSTSDILANSLPLSVPSITTSGVGQISTFTILATLPAGTYHVVFQGDSAFNASVTGANFLTFYASDLGSGANSRTGGVWTNITGGGGRWFYHVIQGRPLDLRLRITSGTSNVDVIGTGVLYDTAPGKIQNGQINLETVTFNSTTDNLSTFTLSKFAPNPDLLTVYYVQRGQAFRVGAFQIQGQSIVFPTGTFFNGGTSEAVTLLFSQQTGGASDNSDTNASLMAENHLGSNSASLDRSQPGRGIKLRRPDGTLRELTLDNNDNIIILSTP